MVVSNTKGLLVLHEKSDGEEACESGLRIYDVRLRCRSKAENFHDRSLLAVLII